MRTCGLHGGSIKIVAHGIHARVVFESAVGEHVERPTGRIRNREARRAITTHGLLHLRLQHIFRALRFLCENRLRLTVDQLMAEAVAADLVAARSDVAHQLRMAFGDPSQNEERRTGAAIVEHVEHPMRVRDDARLEMRPIVGRNLFAKRRDLEIVLDVDGECIGDHCRILNARRHRRARRRRFESG